MNKIIFIMCIISFSIMFALTTFSADTKPASDIKTTTEVKKTSDFKTSGIAFLDYIYDIDDLGNGKGYNKFDIERTYVTFESTITDKVKVKVTTDIYQNAKSVSIKAEDGSKTDNTDVKNTNITSYYDGWSVRLKNAYIDLDFIPLTTIRTGMIGSPWSSIEEKAWGNRFVKKVLSDAVGLFSTTDLGASAIVKLPKGYGEATLAVLNGTSFSKPESDKYKDIVPAVTLTPFPENNALKKFAVSGYAYLGKRASGEESLNRNRFGGMLSFGYDYVNIGAEFDISKDQSINKDKAIVDTNGSGLSAFGEVKLTKFLPPPLNNLGILARFDSWDPNTDNEDDSYSAIVAGLTYAVAKNVRSSINLQQTSYQATDKDATSQIMCQLEVKF